MANPVCCDTSFLFSLYGRDTNTKQAIETVKRVGHPVSLSVFNDYELANAVRFAVFRKILTPSTGAFILDAVAKDLQEGKILIENCNLAEIVAEARRLSSLHTENGGHRSFDILHVATAIHMSAAIFFTFDANQRALARAAGLKTLP